MKLKPENNISILNKKKCALFIAHPGHELRVHHWLELFKPLTFILTDGSGHRKISRLPSTVTILNNANATKSHIYGNWTDEDIYQIILKNKVSILEELCHSIVEVLINEKIECVVGDALEGYNPSHDLCRYLLNAAVLIFEKKTKSKILNYDFTLIKHPSECAVQFSHEAIRINLDDTALNRKLSAAKNYTELADEVTSTLYKFEESAFSVECLRPVDMYQGIYQLENDPPFYEEYGEKQVNAGYYSAVIRYRAHMQPLIQNLWQRLGLEY